MNKYNWQMYLLNKLNNKNLVIVTLNNKCTIFYF